MICAQSGNYHATTVVTILLYEVERHDWGSVWPGAPCEGHTFLPWALWATITP